MKPLRSAIALTIALISPGVYAQCVAPPTPGFTFAPPGAVGAGETYTLAWTSTISEIDDYYIIERSRDSSFSTVLDSQEVSTPSASFLVDAEGRYHHRVRAVPACNPSMPSSFSSAAAVNVNAGAASVVFSVQPKPVITTLGQSLGEVKSSFVLENVTKRPVTVLVTRETLGGIPDFFNIVDPGGGNLFNLTLEPATPKTLEITFDGFATPDDVQQSYQGVIVIVSGELSVIPYAFVNLKVGGTDSAKPYFAVGNTRVDYIAFPGFSGTEDQARPPLHVDIVNPGSSTQEIGAEIGPEVWLVPESGWNDAPIAPGGTLDVPLRTVREYALANSPLPRYTYFTIHTKSGGTARLLVQDNDAVTADATRTKLGTDDRSYVVPGVVAEDLGDNRRRYTILTLANVGPSDITTEIFFTPEGQDGLSSTSVRRALIVVPKNDVVRLTDPLQHIFDTSAPRGQLEIRADSSTIGFLNVAARVFAPGTGGIGGVGWRLPVFTRGEGARDVSPHTIPGMTIAPDETGELVLVETTGVDQARVRIDVVSSTGSQLGSSTMTVPRYGQATIQDVLAGTGSSQLVGARLTATVLSGKGSIGSSLVVKDGTGGGWTLVSQPTSGLITNRAARSQRHRVNWPDEMYVRKVRPDKVATQAPSVQYVIPNVVNGSFGSLPGTYRTIVGVSSPATSSTLTMTLVDQAGSQLGQKTVNLGPEESIEYANVVADLFALSGQVFGTILVDSTNLGAQVYARQTTSAGSTTPSLAIPTSSGALTSAAPGKARPIYVDGLAQSVSSARGSNWAIVMSEVGNAGATVEVRLYEAGNRVVPIATRIFTIPAFGEVRRDSVFAGMDLASAVRSKDRINVMVVVIPKSGNGLVSAIVQGLDNTTNDLVTYQLTPSGGVPATGVALAAPIPIGPEPQTPVRRRPVRR